MPWINLTMRRGALSKDARDNMMARVGRICTGGSRRITGCCINKKDYAAQRCAAPSRRDCVIQRYCGRMLTVMAAESNSAYA
jgi:hypothetical protein